MRAGDDGVVEDAALRVDVGLNDDGGVMGGYERAGALGRVEVTRGGDGGEGLVVRQDGSGDGDGAEQEADRADEGDGGGEAGRELNG